MGPNAEIGKVHLSSEKLGVKGLSPTSMCCAVPTRAARPRDRMTSRLLSSLKTFHALKQIVQASLACDAVGPEMSRRRSETGRNKSMSFRAFSGTTFHKKEAQC